MRTGGIRPGHGVYGVGGDQIVEMYLRDPDTRVSWVLNNVQPFISVENCSLAHLCYEQRLVELGHGGRNPDIGGRSFVVTDAGPPISFGDSYRTVEVLAEGNVKFQILSPSWMLILAHIIQAYYLSTQFLSQSPNAPLRAAGAFLPKLSSLMVNLQPSLWNVTSVHLIADSSNARARPEAGGLGYEPLWTSLEGMCQVILDYQSKRVVDYGHTSGSQGGRTTSRLPRAEAGVKSGLDKAESVAIHSDRLVK